MNLPLLLLPSVEMHSLHTRARKGSFEAFSQDHIVYIRLGCCFVKILPLSLIACGHRRTIRMCFVDLIEPNNSSSNYMHIFEENLLIMRTYDTRYELTNSRF